MARKARSDAEKIAALLGIAPPNNEAEIQRARHEEAVIEYVENRHIFKRVNCRNCKREFAVDRANVSCCGTPCRRKLLKKLGIEHLPENDPKHAEDTEWVWRVYWGREPLIVPPKALEALDKAEALQQTLTLDQGVNALVDDVLSDSIGSSNLDSSSGHTKAQGIEQDLGFAQDIVSNGNGSSISNLDNLLDGINIDDILSR